MFNQGHLCGTYGETAYPKLTSSGELRRAPEPNYFHLPLVGRRTIAVNSNTTHLGMESGNPSGIRHNAGPGTTGSPAQPSSMGYVQNRF